jgi:uncharacterized protein (TIGR02453 family)
MVPDTAFPLLAELEANNNRAWFDANREAIRDQVQLPFAAVLEAITAALATADLPLRGSAATMFRMHRDVRFSADKSPYKASASGLLTPDGTKNEAGGLMYLHMDQHGGFLACGAYIMSTPALNAIRDRIITKPEDFGAAIEALAVAGLSLSDDMMLKSMPRGYNEYSTHRFADDLRRKVFIVRRELVPDDWQSGAVVSEAARVARASAGLLRFVQAA